MCGYIFFLGLGKDMTCADIAFSRMGRLGTGCSCKDNLVGYLLLEGLGFMYLTALNIMYRHFSKHILPIKVRLEYQNSWTRKYECKNP